MTGEDLENKANKWQELAKNLDQEQVQVEFSSEGARTSLALKEAELIGETINFIPNEPPPNQLTLVLLDKIPLLAGFLKSFDSTGAALSQLAVLKGSEAAKKAAQGFQIGSAILASIDLFRIPIMFLVAWRLEVKLPFTLSHAAKLLYSAAALSLALAAILAPLSAGVAIGVAAASLAVVASTIVIGKMLFDLSKTRKNLKQVAHDKNKAENELKLIQEQAIDLAARLQDPKNVDEYPVFEQEVAQLQQGYEQKKDEVQALYDKEFLLQKVWDKELSMGAGVDKAITLGVAAGALCGAVVSIFFPPLGLAIIGGSAVAGGLYLGARVAGVGIKALIEKLSKKPEKSTTPTDDSVSKEDLLLQKNKASSLDKIKVHESTGDTMKLLFGEEKAAQALLEQVENTLLIGKIEHNLVAHIAKGDTAAVLHSFTTMAKYIKDHNVPLVGIHNLMDYLYKTHPKALLMLNQALREPTIPIKAKQELLNYDNMVDVLKERGIINEAGIGAPTEIANPLLEQNNDSDDKVLS